MASLTPEQRRTLAKLEADMETVRFLPDDVAAGMAARTTEAIGFDSQGKPFKAEDMVDIFAILDEDIDEEEPLRQAS